ncbi:MAG: sodium:proton antiporter [Deltaproteobacteria bacterium]|nr:sodium:proton antiporter [Deltaproteobacteria bacterium]MBW2414047.1 sodium:proton antiporter [Deltaproteobacteria bacterium]
MIEAADPTWLSLLPALVTITLAFVTRQVLTALFAGIVTGGVVLAIGTGRLSDLNPITSFLLPAMGSKGYAQILLIYLWCLGGLIGLWERTGGARHFAETVATRMARDRKSSLTFAWVLGLIFHQGGTVSTVLTASTVKPVADQHRVSHEELAYVVDSTASPVATLLAFNAWPAYVAGLVVGTIPLFPDGNASQSFFWASVPFNFYAWFAIASTFLLARGALPWVGRSMRQARDRALDEGLLDAPDSEPLIVPPPAAAPRTVGYAPSLLDFGVPLGVLLGGAIVPYVLLGVNSINEAFLGSVLSAMVVAAIRGLPMGEILAAFVSGCQKMTIGAIVLGLAVTLGTVSKELGTAGFIVSTFGGGIPAVALPAILAALCMVIAFATGTSWGTYAVVFPIAMPLAWALEADPTYVRICFGAVLGGAVFGDQCSPISDTTILSSMFTGCDLMHHVRTQLPLALVAAGLGVVCSTLAALLVL